MRNIVVNYSELVDGPIPGTKVSISLGREILEGIEEALIPSSAAHKVFFVKKFFSVANYRWFVESVEFEKAETTVAGPAADPAAATVASAIASPSTTSPAAAPASAAGANAVIAKAAQMPEPTVYKILLSKLISTVPEEYLQQTLQKPNTSINKLLWQGVLVEVDYGFIQSVAHHDGQIKTNKRYSDTLQAGEMHKRRLAVVVNVSGNRVQVAPVTSKPQPIGDKTCFEIGQHTLDSLSFYGTSGKPSWALCSMIETVSVRRILPPASFYYVKRAKRVGRDTHYTQRLVPAEMKLLKSAMLHAIGVTDYETTKGSLELKKVECLKIAPLQSSVDELEARVLSMQEQINDLKLVEEIASDWNKSIGGGSLEHKILQLRELYLAIDAEANA